MLRARNSWVLKLLRAETDGREGGCWVCGVSNLRLAVSRLSWGTGESWKGFTQGRSKIRFGLEGPPLSLKKVKGWQSRWVEAEGSCPGLREWGRGAQGYAGHEAAVP